MEKDNKTLHVGIANHQTVDIIRRYYHTVPIGGIICGFLPTESDSDNDTILKSIIDFAESVNSIFYYPDEYSEEWEFEKVVQ